ncbi:MAG: acetylserotonin O-methyltransferase [Planctomycetaceae bacterium]|nr:acetylserotonin O-methyltransferase [Planctomycetaceae bacterium]
MQKLQQILNSYQGSCVLVCAGELDLFAPMLCASQGLSAAQIAREAKTDPRGTTVILDALAALGVLQKSDDSYSVPEEYRDALDSRHTNSFLPMIRHAAHCLRQWGQLAWTVKTGVPAPDHASIHGSRADWESFIQAMNSVSCTLAGPLVEKMKQAGLLSFRHVLDVGSGPGTFTIALLNAVPEAKATLFDLPDSLTVVKKRLADAGLVPRATFVGGDFYRDDLPSGVDFVWLSAIIHQHDREKSRDLYRKIYAALDKGGTLAVRDIVMNPDRTKPVMGAFFGVNMLANTETGRVYTFDEIREDMESAGFVDAQFPIKAEDMCSVITAKKG